MSDPHPHYAGLLLGTIAVIALLVWFMRPRTVARLGTRRYLVVAAAAIVIVPVMILGNGDLVSYIHSPLGTHCFSPEQRQAGAAAVDRSLEVVLSPSFLAHYEARDDRPRTFTAEQVREHVQWRFVDEGRLYDTESSGRVCPFIDYYDQANAGLSRLGFLGTARFERYRFVRALTTGLFDEVLARELGETKGASRSATP